MSALAIYQYLTQVPGCRHLLKTKGEGLVWLRNAARKRLALWRPEFHGDAGYNRTVVESIMPTAAPVGHAQRTTIVDLSLGPGRWEILREGAIPTHEIIMVI
jgi:hypothetical protein